MYDPARDKWNGNSVKEPKIPDAPQSKTVRPRNGSNSRGSFGQPHKRRRESDQPRANDEQVRAHYNTRKSHSMKDRRHSSIFGLRSFNNFIKALLIDHYSNPHDIVLDLGCGRGGDLLKWLKAGIDGLIGLDIADVSIEHAKKRFSELKNKCFWTDFVVGNCFDEAIEDIVHPDAFPVDTVSCQFALHYAFDTEERVLCTLGNISRALKKGGNFIGTIPDSEYLSNQLKTGKKEWGNDIFGIRFKDANPSGTWDSLYGNEYYFYLLEAVEDVAEYVVPFESFLALAKEYGLELKLSQPFLDYFRSQIEDPDIRQVAEQQRLSNSRNELTIHQDEIEACAIYRVFVFTKV